jgi:hypothetical protein
MMRVLLFLVSAVLFFEAVFFSALAPLLPTYAHELGLSKLEAGVPPRPMKSIDPRWYRLQRV